MPPLVLSDDEVQHLPSIARRMGLMDMTVDKCRKRYRELGREDLHDELHPGRPRTYASWL